MTSSLYDTVDARYGCITTFANDVGAVSRSLRIYGEWAENEISFLRRLIPSGGTAVDVGAYVGTHTLAFSQFVGSAGSVVSFEPQPDTFKLLEANVADNHVSNVRLENAAVSDASGDLRIPLINILHEGSFGSASLRRVLAHEHRHAPPSPVLEATVPARTIDSLGLVRCDLIKVDAEGVEDLVIRGAIETIRRTSPVIYAECNSVADGLKTFNLLSGLGYDVRMHVVDAFNADNFLHNAENVFGPAREVALVGAAGECLAKLDTISPRSCELLLAVETADDLVLGMLNKVQYFEEILRGSAAGRTGGDVWLRTLDAKRQCADALGALQESQTQLEQVRVEAALAKRQCADAVAGQEAAMLQARLAREEATRAQKATAALRAQLAAAHQERSEAGTQLLEAGAQLELMRASSSWRITAPLRSLVRLIRRGAQWNPRTVETARASRVFRNGTGSTRSQIRSVWSTFWHDLRDFNWFTEVRALPFWSSEGFVRSGRHAPQGCATARPGAKRLGAMSGTDFSQHGEQALILAYLAEHRVNQYCVDAGAYDGVVGSNSRPLFLSGWRGIVIEPNKRTFARLQELYADNPNVICVETALSDIEKKDAVIRVSIGPAGTAEEDKWQYAQVSTFDREFADTYVREHGYIYEDQVVDVTTLTKVLTAHNAPRDIGFITIDCEGEDLRIIKEFDFDRFRPSLLCIESDEDNRHFCEEVLVPKGYRLVGKTPANSLFALNEARPSFLRRTFGKRLVRA